MQLTVAIYETRGAGGATTWHTLGLRGWNTAESAGHEGKLRKRLVDVLSRALDKIEPHDLRLIEFIPGRKLRHLRLELKLKGSDIRVSGEFPVILEPRFPTPDEEVTIAYHPLRPDDWFIVENYRSLEEQARIYFQARWTNQTDLVINQLKRAKYARLVALEVPVRPRNLLSRIRKRDTQPDGGALVGGPRNKPSGGFQALPQIGDNLSLRATVDDLPNVRPREPYRTQLVQRLTGSRKRPVVLIGPPGVGKTALLVQWVHDLLEADGYSAHRQVSKCHQVWSVSGRRIIAGMSYVGQWEERCMEILEDARRQRVVLHVDDLPEWAAIGQSVQSERSIADFFRGPIARGELAIVAECTAEGWQRLESEAPAFASLFSILEVREPEPVENLALLFHAARTIEDRYPIAFEPHAYRTIVELADALLTTRAFPGKALELLESLARDMPHDTSTNRRPVLSADVYQVITEMTGLPREVIDDDSHLVPDKLTDRFGRYVMGQHEAVGACVDVVTRIKAGMTEARRPYRVMLFTGPTGTGKTELAKCLTAYLFGDVSRMVRFDMSEFAGPDGASRLVGDRWNPDGLLTRRVQQQPFTVVLFDEIEKAHPQVLNLLLQVFDEGRLTDAAGRVADFTHAVLIMTSNLGARTNSAIGFGDDPTAVTREMKAAIESFFPPELFNRIDRIVGFVPLTTTVAREIARKELGRLLGRHGLLERQIYVASSDAVLDQITDEGFDPRDGARSLKRYLDRTVGALLSEAIAAGGEALMRSFHVYLADDGFALHEEVLREAELVDHADISGLVAQPTAALRDHLRPLADRMQTLLEGPRLDEVVEMLRAHLRAYNLGDQDRAEDVVNLDDVRQSISALRTSALRLAGDETWGEYEVREALEFHTVELKGPGDWQSRRMLNLFRRHGIQTEAPMVTRQGLFDLLADAGYLERALTTVDDPSRHAVTVFIRTIGEAKTGGFFADDGPGLLYWITRALRTYRGEHDRLYGRMPDGDVVSLAEGWGDQQPREVALTLYGLDLYGVYEREHGSHVLQTLGATSEVVRVEVRPGIIDPEAALHERVNARKAFANALDAGVEPLPNNPDELLPVIRRYGYERQFAGRRARGSVEDYASGWAQSFSVDSFESLLHHIWTLREAASLQELP